ncbi:YjeF family protein [Bacteriovorax sp. BSW11_IV]|uniref:bifunctional ADP-dependent NAD(P)H-hydrate dehydratase/NAD(P)H-hydrate epimerase n=1 Tax=Bacteriovorax sp. BSW11_IV TaxID=1353529 RepID=UPI000389DA2F|nr:bifunctional ADP-dependent NAD(P)H-hydrate dehydratase/NAD(P)H-hydrate epimerase [Bacteriovorax sp. BSW11_IV]EQC46416.1 YjeF family protein [Bacteriovorax sp. BSW11_IV]
MRVVGLDEMKTIEEAAISKFGFSEGLIIENVGIRGADFIEEAFLEDQDFGEIIVLCGRGNNAADGMAIARNLANRSHRVRAFMLLPDDPYSEELNRQIELAKNYGVRINDIRSVDQLSDYLSQGGGHFLFIDAIIGMGFRLPLANNLFDIINLVNEYSSVMVSVDLPSGVTGDAGEAGQTAIRADYTLAIGLPKLGHYVGEGSKLTGEVVVIDAGISSKALGGGDKWLLNPSHFVDVIASRSKFDHKNRFGHTLVIGGSRGMTGAVLMASEACLKVGTGLVTAATWRDNYGELVSRITPEIMTGQIPTNKDEVESVLRDLDRFDSIVIGPGLGSREITRESVIDVLTHFSGPVVIDADAINALNINDDALLLTKRKFPTIMTPHVGEFSKFVGATPEEVNLNPIGYLKKAVDETNSIIVLKSACTYIGLPNGDIYINYFPNDGMATGGSGDVLAGILGGLLAQNPLEHKTSMMFVDKSKISKSVLFGVFVHTLAGKVASENLGPRAMTALSIVDHFSEAFAQIEELLD